MPRLFIFAIGGTGSRVLKSLTMLLAAGIKPTSKTIYEIVPIIIDPHSSNKDLDRTITLMNNYQNIVKDTGTENGFFATKITTLKSIGTPNNTLFDIIPLNLSDDSKGTFKEYIDYVTLNESSKALVNVLFSGKTVDKRKKEINLLDVEMDIGFVGNPNVGSVVLNQFKDSDEFKAFANNFNQDDRIFIISSIFGGTGAAGFPTVLKNIRNAMNNKKIDSKVFLQDAKIGAITVMPYFNVAKDDKSPIQKSDFIAKTKAALSYYSDNITGNKSINVLYYLADNFGGKPYENDPGHSGQKNKAHFVEMIAALTIFDYLEMPDELLTNKDGKANKPIYKHFGLKNDHPDDDLKFSDLELETYKRVTCRLSQLTLLKKYFNEQLETSTEQQPWSNSDPKIDKDFQNSAFYKSYLTEFLKAFEEWLREMIDNKRGFNPYNLDSALDTFIKDNPSKNHLWGSKINFDKYDSTLNQKSHRKSYPSASQKMLKIFFEATENILNTEFSLK